ncbi:MAG: ABC transporter substrate-binding protein [Caldilineales bacterium]|nr:ABC transporter substrate-binding protein [Caldilineales bacterium]
MSKRFVPFLLLLWLAIALAACASAQPAATEPIKVGAIFDLSGATADVGARYAEGVKGYVEWINSKGGVNGRQIQLISQDYGYKVDQAEQLYSQYVTQDKVLAFMGWGTGDTEALRGKIAADKVPFMSASYSINLINIEEAPYNFLAGTSYSDQMVIALQWVKADAAAKGVAPVVVVFHHDSPFGQSPVPDGKDYADANGISYTNIAMPGGATDLTPQLTQAQDLKANYVIIQNVSSPAALLLRNARSLGMTDATRFICLNWCADELFIRLAEGAGEGVVGVLPFSADASVPGAVTASEFLTSKGDSLDKYGLHYTQGWATMQIMAEGIKRTLDAGKELNGENLRAGLESISGMETGGITAPISFSAADHRGNHAVKLHEVQNNVWTPITDYIESRIEPKLRK